MFEVDPNTAQPYFGTGRRFCEFSHYNFDSLPSLLLLHCRTSEPYDCWCRNRVSRHHRYNPRLEWRPGMQLELK